MTTHFKRLKFGYPDPLKFPNDVEGSWKIYTVCNDSTVQSCTTREDVKRLQRQDQINARSTYVSFSNKAQTGLPLKDLYDEKKCHVAHEFTHTMPALQVVKVFRIWGAGTIRVYFIYLPGPGKRIAILKTKTKRQDKLTEGEKLELENIAKTVLNCVDEHGFDAREIKNV
jgi:hypothetical protein